MAVFRTGTSDDYDQILLLKIDVHFKHANEESRFYKNTKDVLSKQSYQDELDKGHVYVLETESKIVGYVFINEMNVIDHPLINDQKILFVDDMCIIEGERGKGLGTELFKKLSNFAVEKGFSSLELNVWDFNKEAQLFYENMGMRRTRIRMIKEF